MNVFDYSPDKKIDDADDRDTEKLRADQGERFYVRNPVLQNLKG